MSHSTEAGSEPQGITMPVATSHDIQYAHLTANVREVMGSSQQERIAYAKTDRWVNYTHGADALKAMNDVLTAPRGNASAPGVLLCGQSGNGKTTLLNRFRAEHPATTSGNGLSCPVLAMEIPVNPTEARFWSTLLHAMGIAHRDTDPVIRKQAQAISVLKTLDVRVLILDEFHRLLLGQAQHTRNLAALIVSLTNAPTKISMILAGTEAAVRALQTDDQLERRFDDCVLPSWKVDRDYLRLLKGFERLLPLSQPSELASQDMARALHRKSGPTIGGLAKVLKTLTVQAIEAGKDRIDLSMVEGVMSFTKLEKAGRASSL